MKQVLGDVSHVIGLSAANFGLYVELVLIVERFRNVWIKYGDTNVEQ